VTVITVCNFAHKKTHQNYKTDTSFPAGRIFMKTAGNFNTNLEVLGKNQAYGKT
jgi:hypothetical protein